jgi:mannitol/fructose-specific phosphotransferase system IIA component (Ntr-type)
MKFKDFVCSEALVLELTASNRDEVIEELVDALVDAGRIAKSNKGDILDTIINRENEASTGMGKGIAMPHVKHHGVTDIVAAVGKSTNGIDFSALDKQPVYSVILMISPADDPDRHLQAMEHLFKHMQNERFRKFLRQAQTTEQIMDLLRDADGNTLFA